MKATAIKAEEIRGQILQALDGQDVSFIQLYRKIKPTGLMVLARNLKALKVEGKIDKYEGKRGLWHLVPQTQNLDLWLDLMADRLSMIATLEVFNLRKPKETIYEISQYRKTFKKADSTKIMAWLKKKYPDEFADLI